MSSDRQTDENKAPKKVPFSSSTAMHLINEATLLAVASEIYAAANYLDETSIHQEQSTRS